MRYLQVIDRGGPEEFSKTLAFQLQVLEAKADEEELSDVVVFVEHDHVYTTGRSEPFQHPAAGPAAEIPWVEIGRGGKATYHGPGQLVAYPIFNLAQHGKDVHAFLRQLETVIISTLNHFGIGSFQREGLTGIWVETPSGAKKIASIGIGVRRWISYHGIAINLNPALEYFRAISACGQDGNVVTSIADVLNERQLRIPSMAELKNALTASFKAVFGFDDQAQRPTIPKRPPWLKVKAPGSPEYQVTNEVVRRLKLVTVCEEARCPNIGECWSHHTATMMIMGELCTRRCSFCSVKDGAIESLQPLDPLEPIRVAQAVHELGLKHIVVTSVNRDDIEDMGARHFNQVARAIRIKNPECKIEFLIPDMRGHRKLVEKILEGNFLSVLNHNVETVPRLYRRVRPGAKFQRSLDILRWAREIQPEIRTKSGLMVGLGETRDEILAAMDQLRAVDVNILTIGQYLQPTPKQLPVERFITPEEFDDYRLEGEKRGFSFVESGPFVRSSYHAWKHVEPETTQKSHSMPCHEQEDFSSSSLL